MSGTGWRMCRLDLDALLKLDYQEMAKRLFAEVLWDYSEEELARCVDLAYTGKFDSEQITPLVMAGDLPVLELFHGPTSAFKDVALCMLPQLMSTALNGRKEKVMIVTATSGDTGKAALSGFQDAENIGITVFYPYGKVSDIQRLQMVCQQGENVRVCAIRGNFDDAQSGVKRLFHSAQAKAALDEDHIVLSSANSINIGRLVPQIVYYFAAYRQLLEAGGGPDGRRSELLRADGQLRQCARRVLCEAHGPAGAPADRGRQREQCAREFPEHRRL